MFVAGSLCALCGERWQGNSGGRCLRWINYYSQNCEGDTCIFSVCVCVWTWHYCVCLSLEKICLLQQNLLIQLLPSHFTCARCVGITAHCLPLVEHHTCFVLKCFTFRVKFIDDNLSSVTVRHCLEPKTSVVVLKWCNELHIKLYETGHVFSQCQTDRINTCLTFTMMTRDGALL